MPPTGTSIRTFSVGMKAIAYKLPQNANRPSSHKKPAVRQSSGERRCGKAMRMSRASVCTIW